MTTYKCVANPTGDDHEFGDHYECVHCGDCEADWWYEHRDKLDAELIPAEPLVMKGAKS